MFTGARQVAAALLVAATVTGCSSEPEVPDVGPAARQLAEGLERGVVEGVVNEPGVQPELERILAGVADLPRTVEVEDTAVTPAADGEQPQEAEALLRWTWDVSSLGASEPWTYETTATFVRAAGAWVPHWDPTLVEDDLRPDHVLQTRTLAPARGRVLGEGGRRLVGPRDVLRIGISRENVRPAVAVSSARRLAGLVDVDPAGFADRVRAAGPRAFVEAIVLRVGDVDPQVEATVADIPGGLVVRDRIHLAPTAQFAAPILGRVGEVTAEMLEEDETLAVGDERGLSGLEARYDEQLAGTPGWQVVAVSTDGRERPVAGVDQVDGTDLRVSLDERMQRRAEDVLAGIGPAAALVAIRPSDGAILAAANGPGTGGVNLATYGRAAPGSTFKIASALALLRQGLTPASPVECPARTVVDGKSFENYDDYSPSHLGRIPLRVAVAQSCNTAFVAQHERVGDGLGAAAASLGLGIDHDLGFPAYFGQVPAPSSETEAAADLIGQGGVLASPMAMATVMASVVAGETVVPWLVDDVRSRVPGEATPLAGSEARALRGMLRSTVTDGSGAGLADVPGPPVLAKTGTAEFDRDGARLLHAWMVAAQGDLAVAVFVDEGESGSRTAGPPLKAFLRAVGG